jgi:MFS family permease
MAYGFSVFWLPMSKMLPNADAAACANIGFFDMLFTRSCNWTVPMVTPTFEMFIAMLGVSAALFGGWLEHAGPRKAGFIAALCWGGGLIVGGIGVMFHQLWMLWLGCGFIGGVGQGLGYISPVSTLIKWFPDRRGMATGMAIMGFGGGAMIGSPLANQLMRYFATPTSVGVQETFLTMAALYFIFMVGGALGYRVPKDGFQPKGWTPPAASANAMITHRHVHLDVAWKTPQFWLIWGVLTLNVSAGIGVIGMASPMLQEVFGGHLIGVDMKFADLDADQKKAIAGIAAGFAGLLSLLNIAGRFFWASFSDKIGRKMTYFTFFVLGGVLYASAPWAAQNGSIFMFVLFMCIILSMYGGGFATVPAYLADIFGTHMVGAIHGRLLTAWSTAGVLGPVLVNYLREYQLAAGIPREAAYNQTLYILALLLVGGFICNLLVRPVPEHLYMSDEEIAKELHTTADAVHKAEEEALADFEDVREAGREPGIGGVATAGPIAQPSGSLVPLVLSWGAVGIPLAWGVWNTLQTAVKLFQ